ncbi:MAG: hypothetical protein AAFY71_19855 [Bacteroidota bacterium]
MKNLLHTVTALKSTLEIPTRGVDGFVSKKVVKSFHSRYYQLSILLGLISLLSMGVPETKSGITIVMDESVMLVQHDNPEDPIVSLEMWNENSQLIISTNCESATCQIGTSSIPSGIYTLTIQTQLGLSYQESVYIY